jgi:hypothetical protein
LAKKYPEILVNINVNDCSGRWPHIDMMFYIISELLAMIAFWKKISVLDTIHGVSLEWFTVKSAASIQLLREFLPHLNTYDCLGFSSKETTTFKVTILVNVLTSLEIVDKAHG